MLWCKLLVRVMVLTYVTVLSFVILLACVMVLAYVMVLSVRSVMVLTHVMVLACVMSSLRGSHGLSARKGRRMKSRGPKGLQLEVGARRAPRLLVCYIFEKQGVKGYIGLDSRSS